MFKKVAFTMYPIENMGRAREFYEKCKMAVIIDSEGNALVLHQLHLKD